MVQATEAKCSCETFAHSRRTHWALQACALHLTWKWGIVTPETFPAPCTSSLSRCGIPLWFCFSALKNYNFGHSLIGHFSWRSSWCHQPNIVWAADLGEETLKMQKWQVQGAVAFLCCEDFWNLATSPCLLSYISSYTGAQGVTQKGSHHPQPSSNSWSAQKQRGLIPVGCSPC